jgi:hypothetical protein
LFKVGIGARVRVRVRVRAGVSAESLSGSVDEDCDGGTQELST